VKEETSVRLMIRLMMVKAIEAMISVYEVDGRLGLKEAIWSLRPQYNS
jgi:hypothetical protein